MYLQCRKYNDLLKTRADPDLTPPFLCLALTRTVCDVGLPAEIENQPFTGVGFSR